MPLPLRVVEPVFVSRGTLPDTVIVQNELEAAANGTLANVIRQLSELSHNAGEIFSDLIRVGTDIATRAGNLQARIDRLAVKVVQLDGAQDEITSMQDSLNTKPFASSMLFDQQVVARESLPFSMGKIYQVCDQPPPLDKLNKYRDDGKDGLKFYTDPNYFFDLWRQDMLKDTERAIVDKVKKPHKPKHEHGGRQKKRLRQPQSMRDKHRQYAAEHGEHIIGGMPQPNNGMRDTTDGIYAPNGGNQIQRQMNGHVNGRPTNIDLRYQNNEQVYSSDINMEYRHQQSLQMNTNHYEAYANQINQHSHVNNQQRYYTQQSVHTPPPPYESPTAYARQNSATRSIGSIINQNGNGTLTNGGFRPSQPPPAPPPAYGGTPPTSHSGTPTRNLRAMNSREREVLPPPPPPPQEQMNGYGLHANGYSLEQNHYHSHGMQHHIYNGGVNLPLPIPMIDDTDDPLPPPPPTPDQNLSELAMAISRLRPTVPEDQLPPSPPPPPPEDSDFQHQDIPPPPPPLPPPAPNANGNVLASHVGQNVNGKSVSDSQKRSTPASAAIWDGRSELLKAIRDGIELRKVDRKETGKDDKAASAYHDVASILARRVAVEMSDSDSDSGSEYDSDVWGDETNA